MCFIFFFFLKFSLSFPSSFLLTFLLSLRFYFFLLKYFKSNLRHHVPKHVSLKSMDVFLHDHISLHSTNNNFLFILSDWHVKRIETMSHEEWLIKVGWRKTRLEFLKAVEQKGWLWSILVACWLLAPCKEELNPGSSCLVMNGAASGIFSPGRVECKTRFISLILGLRIKHLLC